MLWGKPAAVVAGGLPRLPPGPDHTELTGHNRILGFGISLLSFKSGQIWSDICCKNSTLTAEWTLDGNTARMETI